MTIATAKADRTSEPSAIAHLLKEALALLDVDVEAARARMEQARSIAAAAAGPVSEPGGLAAWQRRRIMDLIDDNLHRPLSIEAAAAIVRLSPSHFCRAFRSSFGITFSRHLLKARVERAKALLAAGDEPIAQIALACGMADQSHFTRQFGREAGLTPRAWRRTFGRAPAATQAPARQKAA